jgi:hypothetical protein
MTAPHPFTTAHDRVRFIHVHMAVHALVHTFKIKIINKIIIFRHPFLLCLASATGSKQVFRPNYGSNFHGLGGMDAEPFCYYYYYSQQTHDRIMALWHCVRRHHEDELGHVPVRKHSISITDFCSTLYQR